MAKPTTSPAKSKLIKFIQNTKPGGEELFSFEFEGTGSEAKAFVHQMRVELSRMRDYVRRRGGTIKHWKMLLESVEKLEERKHKITLRRTISASQKISNEVDSIMDELEGGKQINVS